VWHRTHTCQANTQSTVTVCHRTHICQANTQSTVTVWHRTQICQANTQSTVTMLQATTDLSLHNLYKYIEPLKTKSSSGVYKSQALAHPGNYMLYSSTKYYYCTTFTTYRNVCQFIWSERKNQMTARITVISELLSFMPPFWCLTYRNGLRILKKNLWIPGLVCHLPRLHDNWANWDCECGKIASHFKTQHFPTCYKIQFTFDLLV
jgi:hypothetical protein